jgi:hypothetical protein
MNKMVMMWFLADIGMVGCGANFQDSFESYSVESPWSAGVNGWTLKNSTVGQYVSIVSTNSQFSAGSQALAFYDNEMVLYDVKLINDTIGPLTQNISVSFDFGPSAKNGWPTLFLNDGLSNTGIQLVLYDASTMKMKYHNGSALTDVSSYALQVGKWYHAEISIADLSTSADVFDLRVWESDGAGGSALVINETDISFRGGIDQITTFNFGGNSGINSKGLSLLLDDVLVGPSKKLSLVVFQ